MMASKFEEKIHGFLKDMRIPFQEEYTFQGLAAPNGRKLRFDFAVFDDKGNLKCLIEAQGRQHYQPIPKFGGRTGLARQRYNDNLKKQYCLKNHIKLVCIPFTEEPRLTAKYLKYLIER